MNIFKTHTLVTILVLTLVAKLCGLARDMVLASKFGISEISDAFLLATSIPIMIYTLFAAVVNANFIPYYNGYMSNEGKLEADVFTSRLINWISILITILFISLICFPVDYINIFASGLNHNTKQLCASFLRIISVTLLMNFCLNLFKNYSQAFGKVYTHLVSSIPMNIFIIMGIYTGFMFNNPYYIIYGFVVGSLSQLLVILPALSRLQFQYSRVFNIDTTFKNFLYLSAPVVIHALFTQINILVDKNIASHIGGGSISALSFAKQIENVIYALFISGILIIAFPKLSRLYSDGKLNQYSTAKVDFILITLTFSLPCGFLMFYFNDIIVELLFGRGSFDDHAVKITASVVKYASFGLVFLSLNQLFVKFFYIHKDSSIPLYCYLLSLIVNIGINVAVYRFTYWGLIGVSLSTSIGYGFNCLLLVLLYKKKYPLEFCREDYVYVVKLMIVCLFTVITSNEFISQVDSTVNKFFILLGYTAPLYVIMMFVVSSRKCRDLYGRTRM